MDFIKKNWEKVLLGVVLVGLAVAVAFLPLKIASEKQNLEDVRNKILNPAIKPLSPVDLSAPETVLKRSASPLVLDFSTEHRLFNPVLWQKSAEGKPLKIQSGNEVGPKALVLVKTTPLYTKISLDGVTTNETGARYNIGVERQAAEKVKDRGKRPYFVSVDSPKSDLFKLVNVKGPAENPTELTLELTESLEKITISKSSPFSRTDGYLADIKYPPENYSKVGQRTGNQLTFGGAAYNIVAISETEVVVSAGSGKKTTVRLVDAIR